VGSATVKTEDPKVPKYKKPKKFVRAAGGQTWQDDSLLDWDPSIICPFLHHSNQMKANLTF
jgi:hypothetical protein